VIYEPKSTNREREQSCSSNKKRGSKIEYIIFIKSKNGICTKIHGHFWCNFRDIHQMSLYLVVLVDLHCLQLALQQVHSLHTIQNVGTWYYSTKIWYGDSSFGIGAFFRSLLLLDFFLSIFVFWWSRSFNFYLLFFLIHVNHCCPHCFSTPCSNDLLSVFFTGKWCPRREWSSPSDARAAEAARRGVLYSSVFLGSPGEYNSCKYHSFFIGQTVI
jgi:hypothetical protein